MTDERPLNSEPIYNSKRVVENKFQINNVDPIRKSAEATNITGVFMSDLLNADTIAGEKYAATTINGKVSIVAI